MTRGLYLKQLSESVSIRKYPSLCQIQIFVWMHIIGSFQACEQDLKKKTACMFNKNHTLYIHYVSMVKE